MLGVNFILGIVAAVLLLGVIGEKDTGKQKNITLAFAAVVALIVATNTIF